jgi:hypothetical protein
VTLKVVPKVAWDFEIVLKAGYVMHTRKNRPKTAKESLNRNSDAAYGTILRISNCFQGSKQKLYNYFYFSQGSLKSLIY